MQDTPVHWDGEWSTGLVIEATMVTSKGPKVDPRKKENQIAAMCVAADEPKCTGGLRMIKERANNKNLPLLFAGWSYPILLAILIVTLFHRGVKSRIARSRFPAWGECEEQAVQFGTRARAVFGW